MPIYLAQRLILNRYGWTKPASGRLGPAGEGEYVQKNGFGHEDWNFNYEFAINEHIYGYAYYSPTLEKQDELFQFAFMIYQPPKWYLVGFYLDATFAPDGIPLDSKVLNEKKRHLLELKGQNSLGKSWAGRTEAKIIEQLKEDAQWIRWKVNVKNALRLPEPIEIPKHIYNSSNYRLCTPIFITATTFGSLQKLANEAVLTEDDEAGFPEGREFYLKHRAKERSSKVVQLAKSQFLHKNGRFFCQACGFDFEKVYGDLGRGFIETHHLIPVSELTSDSKTKVSDIALVCPNCHRMVHRKRPWLGLEDLKAVLV
jgi:5-methylcytosine-specific restriction enzyme A